jgi:DNA-binding FrmR family transcriptional regulator
MLKNLFSTVVVILLAANSNAQLKDILKQKAGEGVKQGTQNATENVANKELNKLFSKKSKKNKSEEKVTEKNHTIPIFRRKGIICRSLLNHYLIILRLNMISCLSLLQQEMAPIQQL